MGGELLDEGEVAAGASAWSEVPQATRNTNGTVTAKPALDARPAFRTESAKELHQRDADRVCTYIRNIMHSFGVCARQAWSARQRTDRRSHTRYGRPGPVCVGGTLGPQAGTTVLATLAALDLVEIEGTGKDGGGVSYRVWINCG